MIPDDDLDVFIAQRKYQDSYKTRLQEIREIYSKESFPPVIPQWFSDWKDVDESNPHKDSEDRIAFIAEVSIQFLFDHLDKSYFPRLSTLKLFNKYNYHWYRTASIIDAWLKMKPLLPPLIMIGSSNNLLIEDGNHRLHAALCLGHYKLPILVSTRYLLLEEPLSKKLLELFQKGLA